jgi:tetratricopeptide (TPR) repeat protein
MAGLTTPAANDQSASNGADHGTDIHHETPGARTHLSDREALIGLVRLFRAYAGNLRRELTAWQSAVTELDDVLARWEEQGRDVPAPSIDLSVEPEPLAPPPWPRPVQTAPAPTAGGTSVSTGSGRAEQAADAEGETGLAADAAFGELRLVDEREQSAPSDDVVDLAGPPPESADATILGRDSKHTMLDLAVAPPAEVDGEPAAKASSDTAYLSNKYLEKGASYLRQREPKRALACFNEALRLNERNVAALLERGQLYRTARKYEKAITDFNAALEIEDNAEGYVRRGNTLTDQGRLDEALIDYTAAVQLDPENAVAFLNRALVYARMKEFVKVIEDANEALRLNPELASAYFLRGAAYSNENNHDLALVDLDRAADLEPKNALIFNERGLVYARMEKYPQAIMNYGRALRLAPTLHVARFNRALAHRLRGDNDLAIAELSGFLRVQPRSATGYYQRGLACKSKDELEAALADFDKALELNPNYEEAETARVETDQAFRRYLGQGGARRPPPATPDEETTESSDAGTAAEAAPKPSRPKRAPAAEPARVEVKASPAAPAAPAAPAPARPAPPPKKKPARTSDDDDDRPRWKRWAPYGAGAAAVLVLGYFLTSYMWADSDGETDYVEVLSLPPLVRLNSAELVKRFADAPTESESKYKNEVIEVIGVVQEIKKTPDEVGTLIIKDAKASASVECVLANAPSGQVSLQQAEKDKGKLVSVKGLCQGKEGSVVKLVGCRLGGEVRLDRKGKVVSAATGD